jgi:lipopolysaccharide export system permease protein
MKLLHKYIVTEFIKLLIITLSAFISIFILIDFMEKVGDMVGKGVPVMDCFAYFLFKIPYIFSMISPIAVLLSVVLSIGILTRRQEITAIKAGGVGISGVVMPLLICGALLSVGSIFINEVISPITNRRAFNIEMKWLGKKPQGMFNREGLWIRSPEGIYNIMKINFSDNTMTGVTLNRLSDDFKATGTIKAKSVKWVKDKWVAEGAREFFITDRGSIKVGKQGNIELPLKMNPDDFSSIKASHENMNIWELKRYISKLKEEGYNATSYTVNMYSKISFPIVNFLMVLIGIPFALKEGRRNSIADSVAMSVAIGFSFWVIFEVSRSLGHSGVIPPIVAAAFTDVLFLAIGAYLFGSIRQ